MSDVPVFYTVADVAERLGVSRDWVYTAVEGGLIPHRRLPAKSATGARRLIRFTADDLDVIAAEAFQPVVTVRAMPGQPRPQPSPNPTPEPRTPVTPPRPAPGTPRPPSRPGRLHAIPADGGGARGALPAA